MLIYVLTHVRNMAAGGLLTVEHGLLQLCVRGAVQVLTFTGSTHVYCAHTNMHRYRRPSMLIYLLTHTCNMAAGGLLPIEHGLLQCVSGEEFMY